MDERAEGLAYAPRQVVRIKVERTSTGKFSCEKSITLLDLDLNDPRDWEVAHSYLERANDLIEQDIRDLKRRFAEGSE